MDNETKQLLEELKASLADTKKPFFQSIVQSVIVALIVAIPTVLSLGNHVENRIIQMEIKQSENDRQMRSRERKLDYNFDLIKTEYPNLRFYPITEDIK